MSIFDWAVLGAVAGGLIMVAGGIVLIYKGVLVLAGTDKSTALSIEWKKDFKLNTQAPGIAFFFIGLLFLVVAIYASKPSKIQPIQFVGTISGVDEEVKISAAPDPWEISVGSDGKIDGEIFPNVRKLVISISAPGYKPYRQPVTLPSDGKVELPATLTLTRVIAPIVGHSENIGEAPANLQPLGSTPSFGSAQ